MNHTVLKNYAPQARRDFIQAVTDRAAYFGITAAKIEPATEKGDVAIVGGRAFLGSAVAKRKKLVERINRDGFSQTMEALAYTWFNRLVAIRFMELHGYLEHGYRVLSHPDSRKTIPEILEFAEHVDLPGLNKEKVIDLKLDGNKESELYQMLLLAQCHALHSAMPFLFEGIDDETELVLPDNLLHSDSIIRKLVAASDPEDWKEVEVLGWLYQFYISERKDEVIARKSAVPTEDIPAATQLFTPHWIVRYLVENSLGRLWLLNRPSSKLREYMPYYIEGESQAEFLKIAKPEDIRLLDPACGSGHMLTYAFDLLSLMYQEEGYVAHEIPALILRHNLRGLEICPRAAQLAALALVLKAREKSSRFLQCGNLVTPRVLALQNIRFNEGELRHYIAALDLGDLFNEPMIRLLHQFEEATTFGSLIQPSLEDSGITYARNAIAARELGGQLFLRDTHLRVLRVLEQAEYLSVRYHVIVANPPYMGTKGMNGQIKIFIKRHFEDYKTDLFAAFVVRCLHSVLPDGQLGFMTPFVWMFLSSFEQLRRTLLTTCSISSLVQPEYHAFFESAYVPVCAFTFARSSLARKAIFIRLCDFYGESIQAPKTLEAIANPTAPWRYQVDPRLFLSIPGAPLAYWISDDLRNSFSANTLIGQVASPRQGLATGENGRFVRLWHEVAKDKIAFGIRSRREALDSSARWFPYNKGGEFRRWYGNQEYVVDWANDGALIRNFFDADGKLRSVIRNPGYYFKPSVSWSKISSALPAFRYFPEGFIFDVAGTSIFAATSEQLLHLLAFTNCIVAQKLLQVLSPTLNFEVGHIKALPFKGVTATKLPEELIALARCDWDNFETSWDFTGQPLLRSGLRGVTLAASWQNWEAGCDTAVRRMQELETENNRLFIDAYGLADEFMPGVPDDQITLTRADRRKDMAAFVSYAVGCMMGRYSPDKPGLILADAGESLSDYLAKIGKQLDSLAFSPDKDGIIPVLDGEWFTDDIVARTLEFLRASFGEATLDANRRFIEESLGKDLRKYFTSDFYKDQLQVYQKRPIYWLFSSGKERAFQALVYLHRYREGTLSRMRTEYVIPLLGKFNSRLDQLAGDIQKATSTSHRKKMEKERDTLLRQRAELQAFDEKLRHYADQRIQLDLDDGVKVNYGKFGDLLAEVKAVTGGGAE